MHLACGYSKRINETQGALVANILPMPQRGKLPHPELLLELDTLSSSRTMTHEGSNETLRRTARKGHMTSSACQQCRKRKIKVISLRKQ